MDKSQTAIIIPARLGSTRLSNKALAMIGDMSMIEHVVQKAIQSKIGNVYVATDSEEIAKKAKKAGAKPIMAISAKSGTDRIWKAMEQIDHNYKYVINLQGDLPLIDPDIIVKLVKALEGSDADIVTPINKEKSPKENNPSRVKVKLGPKSQALDFDRTRFDDEEYFWHHIGIYGYKIEALEKFVSLPQSDREKERSLEQLRALDNGMKIEIIEVEDDVVSVDIVEDLQLVRKLYLELQ